MGTATGSSKKSLKKSRKAGSKAPGAAGSGSAATAGTAGSGGSGASGGSAGGGAGRASSATGSRKAEPKPRAARSKSRTSKPGPLPELQRPTDLEVDPDVMEFIAAIDQYKKRHTRPFPTWSEILYILRQLGYRRG